MPHYVQRAVHPDRNRSSMLPNAKVSKALLYVGDDSTNDVYVYDYKSGKLVGTLTGFDGPYGSASIERVTSTLRTSTRVTRSNTRMAVPS